MSNVQSKVKGSILNFNPLSSVQQSNTKGEGYLLSSFPCYDYDIMYYDLWLRTTTSNNVPIPNYELEFWLRLRFAEYLDARAISEEEFEWRV